jgi:hypothetical protein
LTLRLKRVNQVLLNATAEKVKQEWADAGEPVEIPTYTIAEGKSEPQTFQHRVTEKGNTLDVKDDPEQTKRNWDIWDAHKDALERLAVAQEEAKQRAVFTFGIDCEVPDDGEWIQMLKLSGVEVPDDPPGRRFAYLWYYALSMFDKNMLIPMLQMVSMGKMVKPDQMSLFRRRVSSAMDDKASELIGEAVAALDDAFGPDGELASEPEISGESSGESA